ncbi:hypothetical protein [Geobacillus thermodenitrificans]|nr:hypothetical protein [Geobacillus thermodenitrificans]
MTLSPPHKVLVLSLHQDEQAIAHATGKGDEYVIKPLKWCELGC